MDTRLENRRLTSACPVSLAPGETLYRQGQAEGHVYVIESGHLKLEHVDVAGATSIAAILSVGQILGPGLGGVGQASHTATAKETEWVFIEGYPTVRDAANYPE